MNELPEPTLRHIDRLTDDLGVHEHARRREPRRDLGYCTDDAGRALLVAVRMAHDPAAPRVAERAVRFLWAARSDGGHFRLRREPDGRFGDDPPSDDATGRALWGLGLAATCAPWPAVRGAARELFEHGAKLRSSHPRATAYATLGAVEVLWRLPRHRLARELVLDALDTAPTTGPATAWPWPESRLTYANAIIPHALMAAAGAAGRQVGVEAASNLLAWLVTDELRGGNFSFTPVGGRGPGASKPAFDQQPIEAWSMAEATVFAWRLTGELRWARAAMLAARWFVGANDTGERLYDKQSGGGYDGLQSVGVNENEGAESSLAFVASMQLVGSVRDQLASSRSFSSERALSR